MTNALKIINKANLLEAEREIINRFRISVFIPFIAVPITFLVFAILLPTLLKYSPGVTDVISEQFILFLNIPILISFLPLVVYYYKVYRLVTEHKASTSNPVVMLLLFICSFLFIVLPWVFVIHLWVKSANLLKGPTLPEEHHQRRRQAYPRI